MIWRWVHAQKRRYYQVELVEDLFADWTIIQSWGGIDSHRGRMRIVWVASQAEGLKRIEAIGKRRGVRGYQQQALAIV